MSKAKHSAEPWQWDEKHLAVFSSDGNILADFWSLKKDWSAGNSPDYATAIANGKLATSAPDLLRQRDELLKALKEYVRLRDCEFNGERVAEDWVNCDVVAVDLIADMEESK